MVVRSTFDRSYWVIAEIVSVSEAKNGHLYFEIAEKENDILQAKIRANIWSNTKSRILSEFEHITKQSLKKGMKVLVNVTIDFHTVFGLSLNILDIDPNFSLGEIERQKQATLLRLEQEGFIDFNKQHVLAPVLQSFAIISSETAAGYQDFTKQLGENIFGYTFKHTLFQATMQGETASNSIIQALDAVENSTNNYDVIVIIRGGGSSLDLSCFDEYSLAVRIAQSLFPIFTGIGHERDTSIADIVAHTQLKTPTAVADYIVAHNRNFENEMERKVGFLDQIASDMIDDQKFNIDNLSRNLSFAAQHKIHTNSKLLVHQNYAYQKSANNRLSRANYSLDKVSIILKHDLSIKFQKIDQKLEHQFGILLKESKTLLKSQKDKTEQNTISLNIQSAKRIQSNLRTMDQIEQLILLADPLQILKKGFSITRQNGKLLRSIKDIDIKSALSTELWDGNLESKITKTNKYE